MLTIALPFTSEETGWDGRILPWEFVISAATRNERRGPMGINRWLLSGRTAAHKSSGRDPPRHLPLQPPSRRSRRLSVVRADSVLAIDAVGEHLHVRAWPEAIPNLNWCAIESSTSSEADTSFVSDVFAP